METRKLTVKRHLPVTKGDVLAKKKSHRKLDEMPTHSKRLVVTRSGRVVVSRSDQQFVFPASQSEGDGEEDSNDLSLDADDEEYWGHAFEQPKWTGRKRRSSCKSSSTNASPEAVPSLVYLELGNKVLIVRDEPQPNIVLGNDEELKTKMHKFLGLMPSRRKLYNPAVDSDMDPQDDEKIVSREENQAEIRDDFVRQANVYSLEECTPDFVKEPIDLSGLPSKKQLAANCRRHKSSVACLERHKGFYGFVQSLSPAISLNRCHPLALTYRQTNFHQRKVALAKVLFNMFNHAIFHCGLQVPIIWKHSMTTRWKCQLAIDTSGKRTAEILLLRRIATAAELIQLLLHGMCHAASFVFNRELSHGDNCRRWAYQARMALPEAPTIEENCFGSFKYTCTMCTRCSYGVADLSTQLLRCSHCQFEVSVKPCNIKIHDGARSDPTLTPFKCFIRDNYLKLGEEGGTTHSSKMALLNEEFMKMNSTKA
ncbi:uncharacterized protein LOC122626101 [Drosophila teissieri]|uniref:uncharacterized protein LOC122626101 n=1 Tax=Drosophila teissieri TaxID=7243 RepID=UPI001CBA4C9D|nr:uncharacterized protein LOC122626101 [Drosophila teissieri]